MSYPLVTAAALLVAVGIAHSYLGERYIIIRLFRRDDLPKLFGSDWFTRRTLRFAWHLTTVAWWGLAAVLLVLADHFGTPPPSTAPLTTVDPHATARAVGYTVAVVLGLHAIVTAITTRGRHLAWPVFGLAAVLVVVGI